MTEQLMNAIVVERAGGPEELVLRTTPRPVAVDGEVLIEVAAAGINFIDIYRRSGIYPMKFPHIPGSEGSGTVRAVGADVTDFAPGDRVAWSDGPGSYAQYVAVPAARVVPLPSYLDWNSAAALPLQGMTAHYLAFDTAPLRPGDTVLVHAGAGGVGLLLIQLLAAQQVTVLTTVSTAQKADWARAAGASQVLSYENLPAALRTLCPEGVQAVFDGVGKATFDDSLAVLARRGHLVLFGGASGQVPPFDLQRLSAAGSVWVTRPSLGDFISTTTALRTRMADLTDRVGGGALQLRIGGTYPLAEAAAAHQDLAGRATTGKLLLQP